MLHLGIIITLSLLCAAGIAIYENPHVQEWIEDSRRKVEMAFRDIGHELNGRPRGAEARCPRDASTQEDETPEAIERRRLARQEILERGRKLEERRRSRQAGSKSQSASFDSLVDGEGALKPEATTFAAEPVGQANASSLRRRNIEARAASLGAAAANPFSDEMYVLHDLDREEEEPGARTPKRPASPLTSPPLPPKPAAYQPQALGLSLNHSTNNDERVVSDGANDNGLQLTPTTSAAPSSIADDFPCLTPQSTHPNGQPVALPSSPANNSYWSVDEWAQQHSVPGPEAFYSPPQTEARGGDLTRADLERAMSEMMMSSENASMVGDGERVSQMGSVGGGGWDSDMDDDGPGISTPGSWTDVGSTVSEDL